MNELYPRILLVPSDLSAGAEKAAVMAARIALYFKAAVHLFHVVDEDSVLLSPDTPHDEADEIKKRLEKSCEKLAAEENVNCSCSVESGGIVHRILAYIVNHPPEMVVMGKGGGIDAQYCGTHTSQLAASSPVPVLVVPEGNPVVPLRKILFPVRPLVSVLQKYDLIRSLVRAVRPRLTLLTMRNQDCLAERNAVESLTSTLELQMKEDGIPYDLEYYFSDTRFAEHILYFLKNRPYDLAVISAERTPSLRFHLSRYVQTLLHRCTLPLLILYGDQDEEIGSKQHLSGQTEKSTGSGR